MNTSKKVYKPKQAWTEQLHHFLNFIINRGANFVPTPVGFDENNEILSYIDGETCDYHLSNNIKSEQALISSAKLLRKYHDISEQYVATVKSSLTTWMFPAKNPIEVICHNDFAPYNILFKGKQAVAIIDFEAAIPGPRLWDIAYAIYRFAPLTNPNNKEGFGNLSEQIKRANIFCNSYNLDYQSRINLVDTIINRLEALMGFLQSAAESGNKKYQNNLSDGHLQLYSKDLKYILDNKLIIQDGLI